MAEISGLFPQRLIVLRHQKGALYYAFIEGLAHLIVEIPINFLSLAIMSVILYFLVGLQKTAEQFLCVSFFWLYQNTNSSSRLHSTYLVFTGTVSLVMKICFRTVAAFSSSESTAIPVTGSLSMILVLYTGYAIPTSNIVGALRWITSLNVRATMSTSLTSIFDVAFKQPLRYAFESLMLNEFHTLNGTCTTLVPSGPGYENVTLANQVCVTVGSQPGRETVPGDAYTHLSFGYSYSHLWRVSCRGCDPAYVEKYSRNGVTQNLGILWAFGFGLLGALLFFIQYNKRIARDTSVTLYKEGRDPVLPHQAIDEERVAPGDLDENREENTTGISDAGILISEKEGRGDVFSWRNIHYEVPVSGGEMRKLLDNISGYVAPGKLTALMGETGAGKVEVRCVGSVNADRRFFFDRQCY